MNNPDLNELEQLLILEERLRGHGQIYQHARAHVLARLVEIEASYAPEPPEPAEEAEGGDTSDNPAPAGGTTSEEEPEEWPTDETSSTSSDQTPTKPNGLRRPMADAAKPKT